MNTQLIVAKLKQYPIAVGSIVLALLLILGIIIRKGGLPEMEQRHQDLQRQVDIIKSNETSAVNLDNQLEELKAMVANIEGRVLRRSELTSNVAYFYSFEEAGKLAIESVNQLRADQGGATAPAQGDRYEVIRFTMQVETTYPRLIQFTHDLRKGDKFVRIESIGITPTVQGSERVRANLSIKALGELPQGGTGRG